MTRVVLVCDDEAQLPLTQALLDDAAPRTYHLARISSNRGALQRILREQADVALIDYRPAAWSGVDLIREIARSTRAPLILLTTNGDAEIDEAALAAGAADCLEKADLTGALLDRSIRHAIGRRRATEALARSEQRLHAILDTVTEGISLIDANGLNLYQSPASARLLGYDANEVVGQPYGKFVMPSDAARAEAVFADVLARPGTRVEVALRVRHRDGQPRLLECTAVNQLHDPAVRAIVVSFRDITDRNTAERKLRAFYDSAVVGIAFGDSSGAITDGNDKFLDITGYTREDLRHGRINWKSLEEAQFSIVAQRASRQIREQGYATPYEIRQVRKDGRRIWTLVGISTVDAERDQGVAVVIDISAAKTAEAALENSQRKFATMFRNSLAAMLITDRKSGRIIDANPKFAELTGYAVDELLGRTTVDLRIWTSPAQRDRFVSQALKHKRSQLETTLRCKSGELRTVLLELQLLEDPETAGPQLLGILTDLTDVRLLEQQFQQAQKMDAIGRLAGGVAHDFNNLLTAILGYGEQLETRDLSTEATSDVAEILKAGRSAAALTRQLLTFSRRSMREPRVIDLNTVVNNMEGILRRLLREDIELRTVLDTELHSIVADAGQIDQIIMNLAVNARDAMPTGGSLTIQTRNVVLEDTYIAEHRGASAGPHVMLTMTDSGTGMDDGVKARLFEPFFTTKERGSGTGLGLAMVYGAVKQSGGSIWVYSEPGAGTTFKIFLPAHDEAAPVEQPSVGVASLRGSETLLLVEDQAEVRQLANAVLVRHGYTVHLAADPHEALEMLSRIGAGVQVLLADVVMPHMSGRQMAQICHEQFPRIRVIYMSGYTADTIVHHGVLERGVAFLEKPFSARTLLEKVRSVLDAETAPRV